MIKFRSTVECKLWQKILRTLGMNKPRKAKRGNAVYCQSRFSCRLPLRPSTGWAVVATFLLASSAVFAQNKPPSVPKNNTPKAFLQSRPDILVVVTQHPLGPDMFLISALDPNYSAKALQSAISEFGTLLGSSPRGVVLQETPIQTDSGETETFLRASFAVDGFASPKFVKLQPLVQAFAGMPAGAGQVKALDVSLAGFTANQHYIQSYTGPNPKNPAVEISAQSYQNPAGVEFRIDLQSQDPNAIKIPDSVEDQQLMQSAKPTNNNGSLVFEVIVLTAAAIGGGILVYNFLLRGGSRAKNSARAVNK